MGGRLFVGGILVSLVSIACGGASSSGAGGASSSATSSSGLVTSGPGSSSTGASSSGAGGAPAATCPAPIAPVDVSKPTTTVGDGSAASCTETALAAAVAKGGTIVFSCGASPITIALAAELVVKADTVIDGGGTVTLSGQKKTRIVHVASAWDQVGPKLVVQRLAFVDGFTTDAPNTKDTTQGGAAIFREGGSLDVIDCTFTNNACAASGQDVSGGAITSQGVGNTVVVGSAFQGNSGSNGGAIGNLGNGLTVVDSKFDQNAATGTMGNPGNGGDGGAIVFDGQNTKMEICGSTFTGNTSKAQGGAIFRVAYHDEPTVIDRSTFDANSADATVGLAGQLYLEFTEIDMTATTIANGSAHYGGGIWIGHHAVANLTNVTIANNTADQGGGVWIADQVTGAFQSCTIAENKVTPGGYATGVFGGDAGMVFTNSLVVDCGCKDHALGGAGANFQFPDSNAPCMPSPTVVDPKLGPLVDNGGPTKTMLPAADSPAKGKGSSCPATDQRGKPRAAACTLGAVELE